jgi:hypothetical protein
MSPIRPTSPLVVGSLANSALNGAYRVRVRGSFAFVSGSSASAITAIDISDPVNPRLAGSYTDTTRLNKTTGLDVDPTGRYVIASSPYLVGQSNPITPPFSTTTGTITAIQLDPSPIAATIGQSSEPPSATTQTTANFAFSVNDAVSTVRCQLDGSPLSLCTSPTSQSYTGLGAGLHTFSVQAIDAAGNTNTASYTWRVGSIPPTITTPPNGATYTQNQIVDAAYNCSAPTGTNVASCLGPVASGAPIDTSTVGQHTFQVTVTDADHGTATSTTTYTVVAPASPSVAIRTPPNGASYTQNQAIAAAYSCTAAAGTSLTSCAGPGAGGAPIDTSALGPHTFQVTATDADGETATSSNSYTVVAGPRPSLTLSSPAANARYSRNQRVPASYSCKAGAGMSLVSCRGTTANGALISTSTVGPHSFCVTATQQDGQTATVTNSYRVVQPPVLSPVRQQHRIWRVTNTSGQGKPAPPIGTTFRFRLSEAAHVLLAFYLQLPGRRVHGACIASSSRNRSAPRCARLVPASGLQINAHQGMNTIVFSGRLPAHRRLQPGQYELVIKARDAAGLTSDPQKLTFRISGAVRSRS